VQTEEGMSRREMLRNQTNVHTLLHSTHNAEGDLSFKEEQQYDHQYIAVFENKMFEHIGASGEISPDPTSAFFIAKIP
jgi:hypothetical protein